MKLEGAAHVHVWKIDLHSHELDRFIGVMSTDECAKAARYHTKELQQHYTRGRCALRLLLGNYLGVAAEDVEFKYGQFGKPELALADDKGLHFNLSHSQQFALIAVAKHTLGVDLEYMLRPDIDVVSLIDIVFHPLEKAEFALKSKSMQDAFFYKIWSRKEAYCKALGVGLQASLSNLRIERGDACEIGRVLDESSAQITHFYSYTLSLAETAQQYSASICLPIADAIIHLRMWPETI